MGWSYTTLPRKPLPIPNRPMRRPSSKRRLDAHLVEEGLAVNRTRAQALIRAGRVRVDGQLIDKPGSLVKPGSAIDVHRPPPYVSRGGEKLEGALEAFRVDARDRVCLDIGASTGGFTDCLLQHGAARVYAVDVGKGILDWKLRNDPRVIVREGINARHLSSEHVPERVTLFVVDVAFISLRLVLPAAAPFVDPAGEVVALVKPQFEAGRQDVGRRGVVRDPSVRLRVLNDLRDFAADELGWGLQWAIPSPLAGPAGNVEFFFHLLPGLQPRWEVDLSALADSDGANTDPC